MNRFPDEDEEIPVNRKHKPRSGKRGADLSPQVNQQCVNPIRTSERVEFDDTKLNLLIIDEETMRTIGRPWLTLTICHVTKLIVGCHLSSPPHKGVDA